MMVRKHLMRIFYANLIYKLALQGSINKEKARAYVSAQAWLVFLMETGLFGLFRVSGYVSA
jgi:hypothetical protein